MRYAPSAERVTTPGPKTRQRLIHVLVNPWREPLTFELGLKLYDELRCVASAKERTCKFDAIRAARKSVLQGISKKLGLPFEGKKCKELAWAIFEKMEATLYRPQG